MAVDTGVLRCRWVQLVRCVRLSVNLYAYYVTSTHVQETSEGLLVINQLNAQILVL